MVDITKTRAQLITAAARKAMILDAGETLEADDSAIFDGYIEPLLLQLKADGIVSIVGSDSIPSEYFLPLAALLANACIADFGGQFDPGVKEYQESMLKKTASEGATYEVLQAEYF